MGAQGESGFSRGQYRFRNGFDLARKIENGCLVTLVKEGFIPSIRYAVFCRLPYMVEVTTELAA